MPKFTILIILIFITSNLKAQTWELGGAAGGAGYMGDLNPNNPVKVSGLSYGGFIKRNFNGYLSAKINYSHGTISGADSTSTIQQFRNRNLSFSTTLSEISIIGEFNFMHYIPEAGKNKYTPYIYLGIASFAYNPRANYNGTTYNLRDYMTEGQKKPYAKTAISIPYGVGIKYNIVGKWTVSADVGYRNPNTDYIDDVSGVYADKNKLSGPVSVALSDRSGERTGNYIGSVNTQRGDLRPRDTYFFLQVGVSYTWVTQKCYFQ